MNMSMFSRFTAGLRKVYRAVKKPVEKPPERKAPAAKLKAKAKAAAVSPAAGLRGARISEVLSSARQAVRASSAFDVSHALTWSRDESC